MLPQLLQAEQLSKHTGVLSLLLTHVNGQGMCSDVEVINIHELLQKAQTFLSQVPPFPKRMQSEVHMYVKGSHVLRKTHLDFSRCRCAECFTQDDV